VNVRLALSDVRAKEHLRSKFVRERLRQFGQLQSGDHQAGQTLLRDAKEYIDQAERDVNNLSGSERDEIKGNIDNLQNQEQQDERQTDQTDNDQSTP
jgi:hypothetical protein